MKKIVQIQIFTESTGRAAIRLHQAFIINGYESSMITLRPAMNDDDWVIQKGKSATIISRFDEIVQNYITRNKIKEFGPFSYPVLGSDVSQMKNIQEADIIYVHWTLQGFLNLNSFEKIIKTGKPVVFVMHDMWNITGGCHHSFTCEKYKSHCFNCQVFPGNKIRDLSYKGFEKKLKLYSEYTNISFISPSKWLYKCAKESALIKNKPIFHIPNIIDTSFFKPMDKTVAKHIFNLNPNEITIAFGAISVDNPYKGWSYLITALNFLSTEFNVSDITILVFGNGYKKEITNQIPFKTIFTGFLRDEYSTMLVYNAADVFIAPSLADNLPTTILESLSCGTPVVGFNVGGIPDMIKHKENGYLAEYRNAKDLSDGIKFCIRNKIKGHLPQVFNTQDILQQHHNLHNKLCSEN